MIRKEVRKVAKHSILSGKSKQETFEELRKTSGLSAEDLAKIVQTIPSLKIRHRILP
jgi:hypothetical protein